MKLYMLNNTDRVFQAESKAEARKEYLHQCGLENYAQFLEYCRICEIPSKLDFKQIVKK